MHDRLTVETTEHALLRLGAGERAWFWFCPQLAEQASPALLLEPFTADPVAIRDHAASMTIPAGALECMGIAAVSENGAVKLASQVGSASVLRRLAHWAQRNLAKHPGLARLKDAQLLTLRADGVVEAVHEDTKLWAGLPTVPPVGSLADSAQAIDTLAVGETVWFWLVAKGPEHRPFLATLPIDASPEAFAEQVARVQRRSPGFARPVRGTLRRLGPDRFALISAAPTAAVSQRLQALLEDAVAEHPALQKLDEAVVFRIQGGKISEQRALPRLRGPDLHQTCAFLSSLQAGESGWFVFSPQQPLLHLAASRNALKALVANVPLEELIRGQVRLHPRGWVEFRSRHLDEQFLPSLIALTGANLARWPALTRLRGARAMRIDASKAPLARYRDDAAWETLLIEVNR